MLQTHEVNTKEERREAKLNWRQKMRNHYPGFQKRKWARDEYRITHPQPA